MDSSVAKVQVNLSLTPEAAQILDQYASQRTRGRFISDLLLAQWIRDKEEDLFQRHQAAVARAIPSAAGRPAGNSRRKKRR